MSDREKELEAALRSFLKLEWEPDAAPGPSFYMVSPVTEARQVLKHAGILLDGVSYFPSDTQGGVSIGHFRGKITSLAVWFDGRAYGENQRDQVPPQYLELFDAAIKHTRDTWV